LDCTAESRLGGCLKVKVKGKVKVKVKVKADATTAQHCEGMN
jgi:hypothetical protein